MLDGDHSLLVAPTVDFERELERMKLIESRFRAVPLTDRAGDSDYAGQSLDAEMSDLVAALKTGKIAGPELEHIRAGHHAQRERMKKYAADFGEWERSGSWKYDETGSHREKPTTPPPRFPVIEVVKGLPGEFEDYFDGAVAWHNPALLDKRFAREAWERLLARPAAERKFKSTWAAFMLGKSWETNDTDKALAYFKQTRELTRNGFVDSLGLAAASLGLEARVHLKKRDFSKAIQLYVEQLATGDATAANSLKQVCSKVLGEPASLRALAKDERARRVITAYLVSHRPTDDWVESLRDFAPATNWLAAVESAGLTDVESAEKLALVAYQAGEFGAAQRWINRAKNSPVAQWLQAKLLLRAGKIEPAAALLAKISRNFPLDPPGTNGPANFAESLSVTISEAGDDPIPAGRQVLGEIGALRLVRRDFVQSLDALLRSGYWQDAAYVAERVLTVEELKKYVDEHWPAVSTAEEKTETIHRSESDGGLDNHRRSIRHLLARRLVRLSRGDEAKLYFPEEYQPQLDTFVASLNIGWDEGRTQSERARAFFQAAVIARTNGMELLGTEVEPDWAVFGGGFDFGSAAESRTNENLKILFASSDELRRAASHDVEPEERFHYRYQAAALAWEAAKLMPDNSDETARVLCTAGTWLKYRDPETADFFYKQLVRRCRKTAIGEQADRMRWFPVLDESGNPKPYQPRQKSIEASTLEPSATETIANHSPVSGPYYTIQAGDSLETIARGARLNGQAITAKDLITANPGLDPRKMWVGQVIFIPAPSAETNAPAN